jgi:hypothetical protein
MRRRRSAIASILAVACLTVTGCLDVRTAYREPLATAPANETVTLTGREGVYIQEINGAKVESGYVINPTERGNTVKIGAGRSVVTVSVTGSDGYRGQWRVNLDFEGGHDYVIAPEGRNSPNILVTDKKTGKQVVIN